MAVTAEGVETTATGSPQSMKNLDKDIFFQPSRRSGAGALIANYHDKKLM